MEKSDAHANSKELLWQNNKQSQDIIIESPYTMKWMEIHMIIIISKLPCIKIYKEISNYQVLNN